MNGEPLDSKNLLARKREGYVIEPITEGPSSGWEGHHATNPTAIRLTGDDRVFLGYRAGGSEDPYYLNQTPVWRSHLGLAVLDANGERVLCRLPLPILTIPDAPKLASEPCGVRALPAVTRQR